MAAKGEAEAECSPEVIQLPLLPLLPPLLLPPPLLLLLLPPPLLLLLLPPPLLLLPAAAARLRCHSRWAILRKMADGGR